MQFASDGRTVPRMSAAAFVSPVTEKRMVHAGTVLLRRGHSSISVIYIESGRVALGLLNKNSLAHQLGMVEGPTWLDASSAVLELSSAVDAVAQSEVVLRHVPMGRFRQTVAAVPPDALSVLHDVARAHRQQTELAVSRLALDAEARCAEWLLHHAERSESGSLEVPLQQRKRLIAAQLGIAPETLSRVLRHLRERSLISGTGRVLEVVDLVGLRALAGK